MERQSSFVSPPLKGNRRRSAITIIAPGEEPNPFQDEGVKPSYRKDRITFQSFKAKPRCPTPDSNGTAHDGEHVNGTPAGADAMLPRHNGNHLMEAKRTDLHHRTLQHTDQAPMPQGDATPPLPPQMSPTPMQQWQPQSHMRRGVASNQFTGMHPLSQASPLTATSARTKGSKHEVRPVSAAWNPSHTSPLREPATEGDSALCVSAPPISPSKSRHSVAANSTAFSNAPLLSSSAEVPRNMNRRIRPSARVSLNRKTENGTTVASNGNSKSNNETTFMKPRSMVVSAGPTAQNTATTSVGVRGSSGCLPFSQPPPDPPLQSGTMFNAAAQRHSYPPSYLNTSPDAENGSRGHCQEVAHQTLSRRSTMPQPRAPHENNFMRVPRPLSQRRRQKMMAFSTRNGMLEEESACDSNGHLPLLPTHKVSEREGSDDLGPNLGSTELSSTSSATGDLSSVPGDCDMGSVVSLASVFSARAPPPQRSQSPLAELQNFLAADVAAQRTAVTKQKSPVVSPPASPMLTDSLANGGRFRKGKEAEKRDVGSTDAAVADDLLSTTDLPVPMESSMCPADTNAQQRRLLAGAERPLNSSSGSKSTDGIREEPTDASISNFSLLTNDDESVQNTVVSSSPTTQVAQASLVSPKLPHVQERTRNERSSTVRLPSPVGLSSLVLWRGSQQSISLPLMSSKQKTIAASPSGSTKADSDGGNCARNGEAGSKLQATKTNPSTKISNGRHPSIAHAPKANEDSTVDSRRGVMLPLPPFRTDSVGPASLSPAHVTPEASAVASLTEAEKAKWSVTMSLSIDTDLFSFSQLPQEKRSSKVAILRNVFESTEKRLYRNGSQAGPMIATPSPEDDSSSTGQVNAVNGNTSSNSSSVPKSNLQQKTEGVLRKVPPSLAKEGRGSTQTPTSSPRQKSLPTAPPLENFSSPGLFPKSPLLVKTGKGAGSPLMSTAKSGRVSSTNHQPPHAGPDNTADGHPTTSSLRARNARTDLSHEASSVKQSFDIFACASPQESSPGFSLSCFKVSNVSADSVNMFDRADF
ncbi:hypothetical protein, unknown function [Leishmania tarentolae]|uniref:Uncharacterized protein n=1 Tax=Leishmania tarentolae TaxID=5689 RepID=A0A640KNA8_LEITA|nr:hypothetical protein, unknown function [Leishmania tarentolae]